MTVKEFIEVLQTLPQTAKVVAFLSDGTMRETESFYYNKKKNYINITPDDDAKIIDISDLKEG